jgi:biopolymer transport protein ExbD
VLLSVALTALLLVISKGGTWGWGSERILLLLGLTVVVLAVWVPYSLRVSQPLVDLRTSARRPILLTNIASVLVGFALMANILISIQQGGGVFIGKDSVGAREDFPKRLRAELQKPENINKPVVIQGDARIPYGEVRRLMKECQELGLGGVALAVKEDQKLGEHERKE